MRNLYFIRHGDVEMPGGQRRCVGASDYPLSALGRLRAVLLAPGFESRELGEVFVSPLSRARETAELMGVRGVALPGLREAGMGEWDGLTFEEIRERWPELFARRGKELWLLPPGAEEAAEVLARYMRAMEEALACTHGDLAFVGHRSATRLFLGHVLGMDAAAAAKLELKYGSVTHLEYEDGRFALRGRAGRCPRPELLPALCRRMLAAAVPEKVAAHCRAVEREALRLVCSLAAAGVWLDEFAVSAGALLHDVARTEPQHARRGAEYLTELGYPRVADIVRQHHGLDAPGELNEAAVVFLADKLVQGERFVGVEARFAASEARCLTPEAKTAHAAQLAQARQVEKLVRQAAPRARIEPTAF